MSAVGEVYEWVSRQKDSQLALLDKHSLFKYKAAIGRWRTLKDSDVLYFIWIWSGEYWNLNNTNQIEQRFPPRLYSQHCHPLCMQLCMHRNDSNQSVPVDPFSVCDCTYCITCIMLQVPHTDWTFGWQLGLSTLVSGQLRHIFMCSLVLYRTHTYITALLRAERYLRSPIMIHKTACWDHYWHVHYIQYMCVYVCVYIAHFYQALPAPFH